MQVNPSDVNEHVFPKFFPGLVGIEVTHVETGKCEGRLPVRDEVLNPGGVLHGGASYAIADTTMALALGSMLAGNEISTTVEIKMSYYKAVREGAITCSTEVTKKGKRIAFLESELRDDEGDVIARASGTYYIISR